MRRSLIKYVIHVRYAQNYNKINKIKNIPNNSSIRCHHETLNLKGDRDLKSNLNSEG